MGASASPAPDNLVRFPVERRARPTLQLMRELAPDVRDVREILAVFRMADPAVRARERAEADVAGCVAGWVGGHGVDGGAAMLGALYDALNPLVAAAIAACWSARDAFAASVEARQRLSRAQASADSSCDRLRARAEALNRDWAQLLLDAHGHVERAEGVAQAIGVAPHDETWASAGSRRNPAPAGATWPAIPSAGS